MEQIGRQAALLVIDLQKELFEKSTPIYKADQLLDNITDLIDRARLAGLPVIFIQHSSQNILKKGSDGWQLHPRIQLLPIELIIHKLHPNAFEGTNLQEELAKRNVDTLVVTGLVTHGCVKATCLGALDLGYQLVLVSDAHSSYSKDAAQMIEKWNQALASNGALLLPTRQIDFSKSGR